MTVRLVLASGSPRRRDFLTNARLDFDVVPADIDESVDGEESPVDYVRRLAAGKAEVVRDSLCADGEQIVVLAADTTIDHDGVILAKPVDDNDARAMLRRLSGATHHCHTGIAVATAARVDVSVVTTAVTFIDLTEADIDWYVSTREPADKAGAYAIQGAGAAFVHSVSGSVSNVVGLPMAETVAMLRAAGVAVHGE